MTAATASGAGTTCEPCVARARTPLGAAPTAEGHDTTLKSRWIYARALCEDPAATLDEILEAATTLEETEPTARRVLGGAHPITVAIADTLRRARAALHAREAPPNSA